MVGASSLEPDAAVALGEPPAETADLGEVALGVLVVAPGAEGVDVAVDPVTAKGASGPCVRLAVGGWRGHRSIIPALS